MKRERGRVIPSAVSNTPPLSRRVRATALTACALTLVLALRLWFRSRSDFTFEDAFMFFRYAVQLHHGYGISWNPGGPHTFGLTSLPWLFAVWLATFFSSVAAHVLPALSTATGTLALILLATLFSRRATSPWLRHTEITFALIGLPLLLDRNFDISLTNGMETMLGLLLLTLFLDQTLRLIDRPTLPQSLILALLGVLAILTRPEALLPIALTPLCALPLLPRSRRIAPVALFFIVLTVLLAADLLFNRWYFGTPVPLAFYIKAVHGYEDYLWLLSPVGANLTFFGTASLAITAILLFARREHFRLLLVFLVPLAVILCYLLTVMQIMGVGARYYMPFLPFLLFPALFLVDRAFASGRSVVSFSFARLAVVGLALVLTSDQCAAHISGPISTLLAKRHRVWDPPVFAIDAEQQLPALSDPWPSYRAVARIAAELPLGGRLALTEVGIVGATATNVAMLDMAGLNNAVLARHHFDMDYIFSQQPDLIWLPNSDYTRSYGIFCTDPRLLRDYTVIADAFLFGIAVRKQSPFHDQILATIRPEFARLYPGADMSHHQVRSVSWNPNSTHTIDSLHAIQP